jgi:4-carboxymuconolactone decarboxylase
MAHSPTQLSGLPPRIPTLDPPYPSAVAESLAKMMGRRTDIEPLRLFRTLAQHFELGDRIRPLGSGILTHGTLDPADRELVILRTCARCGCEYEWGVHVALFARPLNVTGAVIDATVTAPPDDSAWSPRQSLLVRLVDELHDTGTVSDTLWDALTPLWSQQQLIELLLVAGWYHLISFVANGARVEAEPWAARFPGDPYRSV